MSSLPKIIKHELDENFMNTLFNRFFIINYSQKKTVIHYFDNNINEILLQ